MTLDKVNAFCDDYGLTIPIIMAPMAGACPATLAAAVSNAGGMGACGALLHNASQIDSWANDLKQQSNGAFMLNNWVPDPAPITDAHHEESLRTFLRQFAPDVPNDATNLDSISFEEQCDAMIAASPHVISSIMGLYSPDYIRQIKQKGIKYFATVTSVTEALLAEQSGADALIVQGAEAGGHRGNFASDYDQSSGLMALLPAISDAVPLPLIATGGIADSRTISAAIMLGASAVQMGTGFLRTPEAGIAPAWAEAIKQTRPEDTIITKAFSGKPGRAIRNKYIDAAHHADSPAPAPYPIQRALTGAMRKKAAKDDTIETMQAWAGQSARLARDTHTKELMSNIWSEVVQNFER